MDFTRNREILDKVIEGKEIIRPVSCTATISMGVFAFFETYDFSGKTIIPFCTHEGSGLGRSVRDIKNLCPSSNVLDGLAIRGSSVNSAQNDVLVWLHKLGISD